MPKRKDSGKTENDSGLPKVGTADLLQMEEDYKRLLPRHRSLLDEVVFILSERIKSSGIKIHAIESRIKSIESTLDKAGRHDLPQIDKIKDMVGTRVVCLFRSDLMRVDRLIRDNFHVVETDDKLADQDNPLGYQSIHYQCTIPDRYKGPRYDTTSGVPFEIQVRTLCMHCWAAVSHYIDYKGDWDVPLELKRALSALGGLFYVADNEFEQFYQSRMRSLEEPKRPADEINLDTISEYLKDKFSDRKVARGAGVSDLVKEIKLAGYQSVSQVDDDVRHAATAFEKYETEHPPSKGERFNPIGVVRLSLALASESYRKVYDEFNRTPGSRDNAERDPMYQFRTLVTSKKS
jgi:putative GTP pyrophosphokinase